MSKVSLIKNNTPGNSIFDSNFTANKSRQRSGTGKFKSLKDISRESREDEKFIDDFRNDGYETGLKSTQQINLDYSKFENHTFFDSAVSKVNIAFDKIVNEFPFEGSKGTLIEYKQNLTGFENYVFDNFAKSLGYLTFSGSVVDEANHDGQYIQVFDQAGKNFKDFSSRKDGSNVLSPNDNSFSIQLFLNIPAQANDNQSIFHLSSNRNNGIMLSLSQSSDTDQCNIMLHVTSGSNHAFVTTPVDKGSFKHITAKYSKFGEASNFKDAGKLSIYVDAVLQATSSKKVEFDRIDLGNSSNSLLIGTGSVINTPSVKNLTFLPKQTFSGSIDELRFFHEDLTEIDIDTYRTRNVFAGVNSKLALYYRFNEPFGNYALQNVCLDQSGNSLHTRITNYDASMRNTGSIVSPLAEELLEDNPVLYPDFAKNNNLNTRLLQSGSDYDSVNPNLITKLVPVHYLLEGNHFENINNFTGSYGSDYRAINIPKSGQIGSGQLMMSFLEF
jgi:hypothetical protein